MVNRRKFAALLGSSVLNATAGLSRASIPQRPKNVLLLMSDQHRSAALSLHGDTPARTPNLDALARSGVHFTHAYCTTPVCAPSRASLLTGLWTHHHGAFSNDTPLRYQQKTLAHYFHRAGYMTSLIGKMHFVDAQTHGFDYHLDFNDWIAYLGPKAQIFADEIGNRPSSGSGLPQIDDLWRDFGDPWNGKVADDGRRGLIGQGGVSKLQEEDHFESFVTRESIRFLKQHSNQPFFLVASYLKPHDPFFPAQRFYLQFMADKMPMPATWGKVDLATTPAGVRELIQNPWIEPELDDSVENAKRHMALYYASLMQMDENVGKLLQALDDLGLADDTVVLYTSDHGEMLGEHGLWQKTMFYEQSAGVPLILRAPGTTPKGARSETLVSLVDVAPTLLELCGLSTPTTMDGSSLVADLREPARTRERTVFSEYGLQSAGAKAMIREGDYKYTAYSHDSPDELFDLSRDPDEMLNLAVQPEYAAKAAEMKSKLYAWNKPE